MMNHRELIETASKDEWTLECDKKMLDMMQNIASKIETRAASTKGKMNAMLLNLDETKVRMSNLTRINDVKNAVFCENLITDDHLESLGEVSSLPPPEAVKRLSSSHAAIENGLKLMDNCFEKHRVNLDPSKGRSETSLVYRPIDKFYSPLPYLIGSDKWKDKWHLGLIEDDKVSQTGSTYAESVESNVTQSNLAVASSLMASSDDSLAKSTSSIGDQMVINKPSGLLYEETYEEPQSMEPSITQPAPLSSFFRPQPSERKIVNLFDDEPPELDDAAFTRKPVNLFEDDYDSVASLPLPEEKPTQTLQSPPPPVDLFNENEFDDFIKRMENRNPQQQQQQPSETDHVKEKAAERGVQRDMKLIADEIKNVQLKKRSSDDVGDARRKASDVVSKPKPVEVAKPKVKEPPAEPAKSQVDKVNTTPVSQPKSEPQPVVKARPKIANLFGDDDDDESEDFFVEIMKQKSKAVEAVKQQSEATKTIPEKKKITNLFDDEDEDDAFENIFNKKKLEKVAIPKVSDKTKADDDAAPKFQIPAQSSLFDDDSPSSAPHDSRLKVSSAVEGYQIPAPASSDKNTSQLADNGKRKANLIDEFSTSEGQIPSVSQMEHKIAQTTAASENTSDENSLNDESNKVVNEESPEADQMSSREITEDEKTAATTITTTTTHDKVPNTNNLIETAPFARPPSVDEDFNRTIPFVDDEPPADDEEVWETEENNYEEPVAKPIKDLSNQGKNLGYQMPLFDDVPPDDEDFSAPPIPSFDDFEDDDDATLGGNDDLPVVFNEISEAKVAPPEETDPFLQSLRKSIERSEFTDQWSDFKEKIKVKTESQPLLKEAAKDSQPISGSLSSSLEDSIDESDRSISAGNTSNIKSKLDLFTKSSQESSEPPKKLPGKLNTNLKINVSALMPGARLPVVKKELPVEVEDEEAPKKPAPVSSDSTNLLNNEATKSRAKIQVKRRPSTRQGRRSVYEKSLNGQLDKSEAVEEEEKCKQTVDDSAIDQLAPVSEATVNEPQPSSVPTTDNADKEPHNKPSIRETLSNERIAEISSISQSIVTNKIPVFYDDEDETKKMLEEQKRESERKSTAAAALFDDVDEDIFGGRLSVKETKAKPEKPLFGDDESDEDIFKPAASQQPKKSVEKRPLFADEEEDDDDLFGTVKGQNQKSANLFEGADDQLGSIIFAKPKVAAKQPLKQSLFGDSDDDDDDDLFSTKPKNVPSKSTSAMKSSATASTAKKASVVNDPLKDLLDN